MRKKKDNSLFLLFNDIGPVDTAFLLIYFLRNIIHPEIMQTVDVLFVVNAIVVCQVFLVVVQ